MASKATFLQDVEARRSIYALAHESTISDSRIEEIVKHAVLHGPSPFNSQSARAVVLLGEQHQKLWDIAHEAAKAMAPPEMFKNVFEPRLVGFRGAYGTVLFYEDPAPLKAMASKWAMVADKFPSWSDQSSGMIQFIVWTALETEGLGCNLQHYSPMIDARVSEEWKIPLEWSLKAQMVFGKPTGPPKADKEFEPIEKRVFVHSV